MSKVSEEVKEILKDAVDSGVGEELKDYLKGK
jgi:hypothetical protein